MNPAIKGKQGEHSARFAEFASVGIKAVGVGSRAGSAVEHLPDSRGSALGADLGSEIDFIPWGADTGAEHCNQSGSNSAEFGAEGLDGPGYDAQFGAFRS